jgi:hypothetical protein
MRHLSIFYSNSTVRTNAYNLRLASCGMLSTLTQILLSTFPSQAFDVAILSNNLMRILCLFLVCILGPIQGQSQDLPSVTSETKPSFSLDSVGVSPQTCVIPGGFMVVSVVVTNTGNSVATGVLVGHVVGHEGEEDRRRVVVGPNDAQRVEMSLRVPASLPEGMVEAVVSLNVLEGGREVMMVREGQRITKSLTLPKQKDSLVTALTMSREPSGKVYWRWEPIKLYSTYELAIATRIEAELSRQCLAFESVPFPLNASDWKGVDTLIVSDAVSLNDAATLGVLQKFLQSGGHVWVMLDSIDTAAIQNLLGEDQQCNTVSEVELNRFVVDVVGQSIPEKDRTVELEVPVPMKQVVQHGGLVTHSVNGWPAAIWMPVGRGELLITTLGSAGWIQPRGLQPSNDPLFQSAFELRVWAKSFVDQIQVNRLKPPLNTSNAAYPIERIGNPVVPRTLVASVLGAFCVLLLGFGAWRWYAGELAWIGYAAPALAIVASIPLIAVAVFQRKDIPAMVSVLQLAQFESPTGGSLHESAAVFTSDSRSMELVGKGDGMASPSESIESGVRTLTTDDFQQWRLSNVAWPAGTWRYATETSTPNAKFIARGELDKDGLKLELPAGLPSPLKDSVLHFTVGAPSVGKHLSDHRIQVDGTIPAEGERWTLDSIVSDEQRRRAMIYQKLMEDESRVHLAPRTLCGWTDLWSDGPQWNSTLERRGTALNTIPVHLATPELGTQVFVPHPLIEIKQASKQRGSSVFMEATGRWIPQSSLAAESDLAFALPPEVVPLEVSSIQVDWDIQAPNRQVRLLCIDESNAKPIEVVSLKSPSIPWKGVITDPVILKDFQDGRMVLRVEVSNVKDSEHELSWHVSHLRVSVSGRTLPRNNLVSQSTK